MLVVDEASTVLTTVENQVDGLNENIDNLSPMEIGKAIGTIETNLDSVTPNKISIDCESIDTAKRDLEAISDTIKKAWEAIKKFFTEVWNKIKSMYMKAMIWFRGSSKNLETKSDDLDKKLTENEKKGIFLKEEYRSMNTDKLYDLISNDIGDSLMTWFALSKSHGVDVGMGDLLNTLTDYFKGTNRLYELDTSSWVYKNIPEMNVSGVSHYIMLVGPKVITASKFKSGEFLDVYIDYNQANNYLASKDFDTTFSKPMRRKMAEYLITRTKDLIDYINDINNILPKAYKIQDELFKINEKIQTELKYNKPIDIYNYDLGNIEWLDDPRYYSKPADEELLVKATTVKAIFCSKRLKDLISTTSSLVNDLDKYLSIIAKYKV